MPKRKTQLSHAVDLLVTVAGALTRECFLTNLKIAWQTQSGPDSSFYIVISKPFYWAVTELNDGVCVRCRNVTLYTNYAIEIRPIRIQESHCLFDGITPNPLSPTFSHRAPHVCPIDCVGHYFFGMV